MTTQLLEKKSSRLDLRMSDEQKRQIEEAAYINGMSVSQWSMARLMESARKDIAEQASMRLSAEAFDEFARMLDGPADPAFSELAEGSTRWDG